MKKGWLKGKFNWQEGFGAFSHSPSEPGRIVRYIQGQEEHHSKKTFTDEYVGMLRDFRVEFDRKYIFEKADPE
jgi:hypothetical protein